MTTEQLNIIITAQTADFTEKLGAVNTTLRETVTLAEQAAEAAAKVVDPTGESAEGAVSGSAADGIYRAPEPSAGTSGENQTSDNISAGTFGGFPQAPSGSARAAVQAAGERADVSALEKISPAFAAANVLRLDRSQTLVGAVSGSGNEQSGQNVPIEIHTTVELDGDRIGEAVSAYNGRRSRITDGFVSR